VYIWTGENNVIDFKILKKAIIATVYKTIFPLLLIFAGMFLFVGFLNLIAILFVIMWLVTMIAYQYDKIKRNY